MVRRDSLNQLCRVLQGLPTSPIDWPSLVALANRSLITPRLEGSLESANAPEDVHVFVKEVARRNRERNARLLDQLDVAASALNAIGIEPLVIKGGACLVRNGGYAAGVISDIDLVVRPNELDATLVALGGVGFNILSRQDGVTAHALATLGRAVDVGEIDLHQRPPGPPSFTSGSAFLDGEAFRLDRGLVRTPHPHMHIYLQALHDQLHDGAYWRGGFDLRHAWDIADMLHSPAGVDWTALEALPPTRLTAHAVEAQLAICRLLTGARMPPGVVKAYGQYQAQRQHFQYRWPLLTLCFAGITLLSEAMNLAPHRRRDREGRTAVDLPPHRSHFGRSLNRLYHILTDNLRGGRV
jgi:hypothetical protein